MELNVDIEALSVQNDNFRKVILSSEQSQVVLMSIPPGGEIGEETHDVDQVLAFIVGEGKAVLNGEESVVGPGRLVHVPAGTLHNFVNTGVLPFKLYTVYAPPEHEPGTVHATKEEADEAEANE